MAKSPESTLLRPSLGLKPHLQSQFQSMWRHRLDSADLELVCADGQVDCHCLILAAHSRFLHQLLRHNNNSQLTVLLPRAEKREVQAVVKLLYTGKLRVRADQVNVVKDLMENVLRIDAKLDLQHVLRLSGQKQLGQTKSTGRKRSSQDEGEEAKRAKISETNVREENNANVDGRENQPQNDAQRGQQEVVNGASYKTDNPGEKSELKEDANASINDCPESGIGGNDCPRLPNPSPRSVVQDDGNASNVREKEQGRSEVEPEVIDLEGDQEDLGTINSGESDLQHHEKPQKEEKSLPEEENVRAFETQTLQEEQRKEDERIESNEPQQRNEGDKEVSNEKEIEDEQSQNEEETRSPAAHEPELIDIASSDDEEPPLRPSEDEDSMTIEDDIEIEEVVLCNYCDKAFSSRSALAEHLMEHSAEKSFRWIKRENEDEANGNEENNTDDTTDRCQVIEAPTIISKHTGSLTNRQWNSAPPRAPGVVAKRTGWPIVPLALLQARQQPVRQVPQQPLQPEQQHTEQSGGVVQQPVQQQMQPMLPPPIPEPPQEGMVISRGKWVPLAELQRREEARQRNASRSTQRPKSYNYQPVVNTLSGRSLPSTYELEPDGDFPCPEPNCNARYKQKRSLMVHISRKHHSNLKAECPECQQRLSSKAAIKKHLLRHRPESDWPFQCPFCRKKFQAKGDLPKHWKTKKHANDPIPVVGSPEWHQLLAASICAPLCDVNSALVSARAGQSVPSTSTTTASATSTAPPPSTTTTATNAGSAFSTVPPPIPPNAQLIREQLLTLGGLGMNAISPQAAMLANLALNL